MKAESVQREGEFWPSNISGKVPQRGHLQDMVREGRGPAGRGSRGESHVIDFPPGFSLIL